MKKKEMIETILLYDTHNTILCEYKTKCSPYKAYEKAVNWFMRNYSKEEIKDWYLEACDYYHIRRG